MSIDAAFCFPLLGKPGDIRWRADLAGGALMDAGCYPINMVRAVAHSAGFDEPEVVGARIASTRAGRSRGVVDRAARGELRWQASNGAPVAGSVRSAVPCHLGQRLGVDQVRVLGVAVDERRDERAQRHDRRALRPGGVQRAPGEDRPEALPTPRGVHLGVHDDDPAAPTGVLGEPHDLITDDEQQLWRDYILSLTAPDPPPPLDTVAAMRELINILRERQQRAAGHNVLLTGPNPYPNAAEPYVTNTIHWWFNLKLDPQVADPDGAFMNALSFEGADGFKGNGWIVKGNAAALERALDDPATDVGGFLRFAHRHQLGAYAYRTLRQLGLTRGLPPAMLSE